MNLLKNRANTIADPKRLPTDQILARQLALGVIAKVDDNCLSCYLFDRARQQLANTVLILLDNLCPLCLTDLLDNYLFGCLRCNAAEADIFDLFLVTSPAPSAESCS